MLALGAPVANLKDLLGPFDALSLIGGGGKTRLLQCLEEEFHAAHEPSLVSASTQIGSGQLPGLERLIIGDGRGLAQAGQAALGGARLFLRGPESLSGLGKIRGPGEKWLLRFAAAFPQVKILMEADGSRGLPLKAHDLSREPRLYGFAGHLTAAVIGLKALEEPFGHVCHRPEFFVRALGRKVNPKEILKPADLALYLENIFKGGRQESYGLMKALILNQADSPRRMEAGLALAELLTAPKPPFKIILASARDRLFYGPFLPETF